MQEANLRKRSKVGNYFSSSSSNTGLIGETGYCNSWKFPFFPSIASIVIGFAVLLVITRLVDHRFPAPVYIDQASSHPGSFIGERAYKHLERLTSIGPRVAGSYENEVRTVDLLMREIGFIKQFAHPAHLITMDVQKPSGVLTPITGQGLEHNTIYHSLANVVVKIESRNGTNSSAEALLVNAHFDTVHGSPGLLRDINTIHLNIFYLLLINAI